MTVDLSLLKVIDELDGNAVLARIIQKEGSGPREKGAEMLITEKSTYSTIGGGAIEMEAVKEARNMLSSHISFRILDFSLTEDSPLEMACGGNARVMLRTVK